MIFPCGQHSRASVNKFYAQVTAEISKAGKQVHTVTILHNSRE